MFFHLSSIRADIHIEFNNKVVREKYNICDKQAKTVEHVLNALYVNLRIHSRSNEDSLSNKQHIMKIKFLFDDNNNNSSATVFTVLFRPIDVLVKRSLTIAVLLCHFSVCIEQQQCRGISAATSSYH